MKARDVMTAPVVAVAPGDSIKEVAALLLERRISGVPVVSDAEVVGMVSEGDLLRRYEIGTERTERRWWVRLLQSDRATADYVRSHAVRVADVMTRPVVCVTEDQPIADIVALFEARRIRRVPVLRGRQLVGMVSRADLVMALAARARRAEPRGAADDRWIRDQLIAELARQPWWQHYASTVVVSSGVVHFWGLLDSEDEKKAARVAAENIAGVRKVVDHRRHYNSLASML
jgi:CBS domain-containing protein